MHGRQNEYTRVKPSNNYPSGRTSSVTVADEELTTTVKKISRPVMRSRCYAAS